MINIRTISRTVASFTAAALVAGMPAAARMPASDPTEAKATPSSSEVAADKKRYCMTVAKKEEAKKARSKCQTRSAWLAEIGVDPGKR